MHSPDSGDPNVGRGGKGDGNRAAGRPRGGADREHTGNARVRGQVARGVHG
jgi:hypothetical protein